MPNSDGLLTRAASTPATSWNPEALTFEVVLSTGAAVERRDNRGAFDEVLRIVNCRCVEPLPLLDSHRQDSLDRRLGEVSGIHVENGALVGTARLSRHNPAAQRIAAELTDGARLGVSIGYRVGTWTEHTDPATRRRTKVGTGLSILEASLVAVPADPAAGIRSHESSEGSNMIETTEAQTPAETQTRAQLNAEIRAIATSAGLSAEWVNRHLDADTPDLNAIRADALAEIGLRSRAAGDIRATVTSDANNDPVEIRSVMADALAHRIAPSAVKLEGRARDYAGLTTAEMLNDLAAQRGERLRLRSAGEVFERGAMVASDFAALTSDAANKALLSQYQAAVPSYRQWAARKTFADFKTHRFLRVGDFPAFKPVGEIGEMEHGDISENLEVVRADAYGTAIALSRVALINDDLGALADFSAAIATRAAADENRMVYAKLTSNPVLADGKALFHAEHGNLAGTGGAISVTTIGAAFAALRKQTGLDGIPLNLVPRLLLVGPDIETEARQFITSVTPNKTSDVNPWSGSLELVVDANLTGRGWYILADPGAAPTVVYGWLTGHEGPQIRTEIDFGTRALHVAAGLDFGCGAIDHRGGYRNAGA